MRTEVSLWSIGAYPPAYKPYWLEAAPVGGQRAEDRTKSLADSETVKHVTAWAFFR